MNKFKVFICRCKALFAPKRDWHAEWRRFELTTNDEMQIRELNAVLERLKLSRHDLAIIVGSLRVRQEFELKDFDT